MSGRSFRETITVEAEAYIDQFPDDVILDQALEIIKEHRKGTKPEREGYALDQWKAREKSIQTIITEFAVPVVEESDLPPPSTAAKIKTVEELHDWIKKNGRRVA